ncbi:MAG: adenylyltransferase/cytidyltransferase family protein [Candidatus Peribacteraceae bacterium]|nr:adenylyltransferase/cytidyltransferase family protein [Candidatus Peribacteraceae bacterium]
MRVLVFGTFDRLHPGHRFLLAEASRRGDLTVVIARDATVQRIKGRVPHEGEEERCRAIRLAFPDAQVVLGHPVDYLDPVRQIQPDLIIMGYDQALPPGVATKDFPCRVERLPAFQPERFKSSHFRK